MAKKQLIEDDFRQTITNYYREARKLKWIGSFAQLTDKTVAELVEYFDLADKKKATPKRPKNEKELDKILQRRKADIIVGCKCGVCSGANAEIRKQILNWHYEEMDAMVQEALLRLSKTMKTGIREKAKE